MVALPPCRGEVLVRVQFEDLSSQGKSSSKATAERIFPQVDDFPPLKKTKRKWFSECRIP